MSLVKKKVYLFEDIMRFKYPTAGLMLSNCLPGFISNLLRLKVMTKSTLFFCHEAYWTS